MTAVLRRAPFFEEPTEITVGGELVTVRPFQKPFALPLREGIAVYPSDHPQSPRLPLLGLRALVRNDLRLTIDGKRKTVGLDRTSRWFGD